MVSIFNYNICGNNVSLSFLCTFIKKNLSTFSSSLHIFIAIMRWKFHFCMLLNVNLYITDTYNYYLWVVHCSDLLLYLNTDSSINHVSIFWTNAVDVLCFRFFLCRQYLHIFVKLHFPLFKM